jgi:nicotinate-nucleotide adenylyltransferase
MTANKRIGIFGGTFNPVHKAHVEIAKTFLQKFSLDLLYIIPNNIPPLKESHGVSGEDRMNMLKIAFSENDNIVISDIELERVGTSYTCDTIKEIKEIQKDGELFFLMGDDWIDNFDKWKNYRYILDNVNLVIAYRGDRDIKDAVERLENLGGKRVFLLGNERIKLSSSGFRSKPEKETLPDGVFEYIRKRGLYGI